jgi:hypothetical protein
MTTPQLLEAAMLCSFSVGWYFSIAKMLRTGQASGKSAMFVLLICTGYSAGCAAKVLNWQDGDSFDPVIWVYVWNLMVTSADLALVLVLTRRARGHRAAA